MIYIEKRKNHFQIMLSPEIFQSFGFQLIDFLSHKGFDNVSFEDNGELLISGSRKEARQVSMLTRAFLHKINN